MRPSVRAAWTSWLARGRTLAASRSRLVTGAAIGLGALLVAATAALLAWPSLRVAPSPSPPSSAPGAPAPIVGCAPRGTDATAQATEAGAGRVSAPLDGAPLAESLRAAGIEPGEAYRVRRALEAIPGFVSVDRGRLVATRGASGAIEAFEIRTPTWTYRARTGADGQLVAERTTDVTEARLCSGVIRLAGTLEESVKASPFAVDAIAGVRDALAGRLDPTTLPPGTELRLVAREIEALGAFGGYDGLAAIEVRAAGAETTRLYGVRTASQVRWVDGAGAVVASAAPPSEVELAAFRAAKPALDAALDGAASSTSPAAASASAEPVGEAPSEGADPPPDEPAEPAEDDKPIPEDPTRTVAQAAKATCSTRIVAGLSKQIIAEARCLDADAFARIPGRKNLRASSNVFLFLEAPARDHLLRALDAHPQWNLTVNSALRTVAQQVLLSKWGETKRCGVRLAALPSESNHESGLALDVQESSQWRKALEKEGFRWMGRKDPVHFDYAGPGAVDHRGLDVRAFQRLWTRNHRDDPLGETGKLDAKTKQRLLKSPAMGFPTGARCAG